MSVKEYLRTHTRREHLTLLAWLNEQYNRPARADWYSMQIAVLLEAILNRLPGSTPTTKLDSKKVKFGDEATPGQGKKFPVAPLTKEQIVKIKSALARARSQGLKGTRITSPNAPLRTHHDPPKR